MKIQNYLEKFAMKYPTLRILPTKKFEERIKRNIKKCKKKKIDLGITDSTIRCILCGSRKPSIKLIEKLSLVDKSMWDFTFKEINKIRSERSEGYINLIKELTPELAYLLGAMRDGSISRHKYQIQITQKRKEWVLNIINPLMKEIFGKEFNYRGFKRNVHIFDLGSKALYAILDIIGNLTNELKETPPIIKNAPFNIQRFYIGGFYDAEGDKSIKSNRIGCYQGWLESGCPPLEDIQNMLKSQGIISSVKKQSKKKNYRIYRLYVFKRPSENIIKFLNLIPLFHPDSLNLKEHFVAAQ